jgi:formylglycine-generating enzyme required for sulfatase activity
MEFVRIPAGTFRMGSRESAEQVARDFPGEEAADFANEHPERTVRISRDFHLSIHEVTVAQFRRFVEETGYLTDVERVRKPDDPTPVKGLVGRRWWRPGVGGLPEEFQEDHPVTYVSWNDAQAFCHWLSRIDKEAYRLPTQGEWEYACRAGAGGRFSFGNDPEELARNANVPDEALGKANPAYGREQIQVFVGDAEAPGTKQGWSVVQCSPGGSVLGIYGLNEKASRKLWEPHVVRHVPEWVPSGYVLVYNRSSELSLTVKASGQQTEIPPRKMKAVVTERATRLGVQRIARDDGFAYLAPVGSFAPNPWGLFDMHGNVWEYCEDGYAENWPEGSTLIDPTGPAESDRIAIRGGCYM